jgi:hypothetical protein
MDDWMDESVRERERSGRLSEGFAAWSARKRASGDEYQHVRGSTWTAREMGDAPREMSTISTDAMSSCVATSCQMYQATHARGE